jgi:hypothetical protein
VTNSEAWRTSQHVIAACGLALLGPRSGSQEFMPCVRVQDARSKRPCTLDNRIRDPMCQSRHGLVEAAAPRQQESECRQSTPGHDNRRVCGQSSGRILLERRMARQGPVESSTGIREGRSKNGYYRMPATSLTQLLEKGTATFHADQTTCEKHFSSPEHRNARPSMHRFWPLRLAQAQDLAFLSVPHCII